MPDLASRFKKVVMPFLAYGLKLLASDWKSGEKPPSRLDQPRTATWQPSDRGLARSLPLGPLMCFLALFFRLILEVQPDLAGRRRWKGSFSAIMPLGVG